MKVNEMENTFKAVVKCIFLFHVFTIINMLSPYLNFHIIKNKDT